MEGNAVDRGDSEGQGCVCACVCAPPGKVERRRLALLDATAPCATMVGDRVFKQLAKCCVQPFLMLQTANLEVPNMGMG